MKNYWAIVGFYGQKNFGDDLFCYVMSSLMKTYKQQHFIQNGLIKSKDAVNYSHLPGFWRFIQTQGALGSVSRVLSNISAVIGAEKIVFGGGSVFGRYASYKQRALVVNIAKFLHRDLYAFGVSIGPFASNQEEEDYRALLNRFKFILARDEESWKAVQKHNLNGIRGCDMVWSISSIHKKKECKARRLIISMHRHDDIKAILDLGDFFENFEQIEILNLDSESVAVGTVLAKSLADRFTTRVEVKNYFDVDIEDVLDDISSAAYVITSKLHGAITAAAYGVPFSLLEYQEKCTEFVRSFGNLDIFLNRGDIQIFIKNTPEIYRFGKKINFNVGQRCSSVHSCFVKMLNA